MEPKAHPSQATLRCLFDYDPDGHLIWKASAKGVTAGMRAGYQLKDGYCQIMINQQHHKTHRLVWVWHNGDIQPGLVVDHINDNKSDNRICNLQLLTASENTGKHYATNKTSGLPLYVRHNNGGFQARYKGKTLGTFSTVDEAVAAVEAVK